ncbi:hypothetical protein JG687_00013748, partial [Phytophthora cactorum]
PDRAPRGWIQASIAEGKTRSGGLGVPNFKVERVALAAMTVRQWALSESRQMQAVGAILQHTQYGSEAYLTPTTSSPKVAVATTIWKTGKPWTKELFAEGRGDTPEDIAKTSELRWCLTPRNGLRTRW